MQVLRFYTYRLDVILAASVAADAGVDAVGFAAAVRKLKGVVSSKRGVDAADDALSVADTVTEWVKCRFAVHSDSGDDEGEDVFDARRCDPVLLPFCPRLLRYVPGAQRATLQRRLSSDLGQCLSAQSYRAARVHSVDGSQRTHRRSAVALLSAGALNDPTACWWTLHERHVITTGTVTSISNMYVSPHIP